MGDYFNSLNEKDKADEYFKKHFFYAKEMKRFAD